MWKQLRPWPAPPTRSLRGMASILVLLLIVTGSWWLIPACPPVVLPISPELCDVVHVSTNGQTLVACCTESLRVWDLGCRKEVAVVPYKELREYEIVLSPDGQTLAIRHDERHGPPPLVCLWHFATQAEPISLPDSDGLVGFTADSKNLIVRHGDSDKLWDSATARERRLPLQFLDDNFGIKPLRDGRVLLSRSSEEIGWLADQHWTEVWTLSPDLETASSPIVLLHVAGPVTSSPDGRVLASLQACENGLLCKLFDARTGRELASTSEPANDIPFFSPDGSRLVTALGGTHTIWDVTTMPPRRLGSTGGRVTFSPNGRWIESETSVRDGHSKTILIKTELLDAANLAKSSLEIVPEPIIAPDGRSFVEGTRIRPSSIKKLFAKCLPRTLGADESNGLRLRQLPGGREIASFARVPFCV